MRINTHIRFYCWGCHSKYIQISALKNSALGVSQHFNITCVKYKCNDIIFLNKITVKRKIA